MSTREFNSPTEKPKLDLSKCAGFDPKLEAKRADYFRQFHEASNPEDQREAMRGAASLTALREASFVSDYDRLLGIQVDE